MIIQKFLFWIDSKTVKVKNIYIYITLSVITIENLETLKKSYVFDKTLVLPIISGKWGQKDEVIFEETRSTEILNFLVQLKIHRYFRNVTE